MADVGVWGLRAIAVFERGRAADGESVDERVNEAWMRTDCECWSEGGGLDGCCV